MAIPFGSVHEPYIATDIHLNFMFLKPNNRQIYPSDEIVLETKRMILKPFNDSRGYFLEFETGEGMQIRADELDELLYRYFKKNF